MTTSNTVEIRLPFRRSDGKGSSFEKLTVEQIGSKHFRLLYSPGMVEGLAAGDEIELSNNDPSSYRLVKRSGNLCVWFFFDRIGQNKGPEAERIREAVETIGGWLDGGGEYSLVFTIPVSVGFPAVERLFTEAEAQNEGSAWMFGNVYDPRDGQTPLNWWK